MMSSKETMFNAFQDEINESIKLLKEVQEHLKKQEADNSNKDWGDVGSAKAVKLELKAITDRLYKRGEHAE